MGPGDKFCLQWNDFEKNISQAFKQLREDQDFFDVTIACEDEEVEAHKLVLSASSPFFQALFKRYKHDHPLLYLKNVKYSDFSNLLDFIYYGMHILNNCSCFFSLKVLQIGFIETYLFPGSKFNFKTEVAPSQRAEGRLTWQTFNLIV